MSRGNFKYVIVGAGVAGASAINGIREWDSAPILLVGAETQLPYHRSPLSKELWLGNKPLDEIWVEPEQFWAQQRVELLMGTSVVGLDARRRQIVDSHGQTRGYQKLLIATGAHPRRLEIPGSDIAGVFHFRTVEDYLAVRQRAQPGKRALIVGDDLVGAELAIGLAANGVTVTMLLPKHSVGPRVLPKEIGRMLVRRCVERGIRMVVADAPASISRQNGALRTTTQRGASIESEVVVVALGFAPSLELARQGGLRAGDGILVDEYLRTSEPDIFAAGDNASFLSAFLGERRRLDRSQNAWMQGELAGVNMTGKLERYDEMPLFSSTLFDLELAGIGDIDATLDTLIDWQEEERVGTIFYLRRGQVRGVLLCNRPGKLEAAREMIMRSVPGNDEEDPRLWL